VIRILAVGDIMGKAGRRCLDQLLDKAREKWNPNIIVVNGENAAGGFGLTKKIYDQFTGKFAIDAITMGNHWHDKREIYEYFQNTDRLVLPANMSNVDRVEDGLRVITAQDGTRFAVINLIGKAFMKGENDCPFRTADQLLSQIPKSVKIRILDLHAETSSEKQGLANYLEGRVSLIYGTHTHVPTADERIIGGKTGFITDLGMTGAYDSVIGIRKESAILRMMTGERKKFEPATSDPWMCGVVATIDEQTGYCQGIERFRWELSDFQS
jgi:2',3'-cyclic-nucleotide 2'-phosphodiesterase